MNDKGISYLLAMIVVALAMLIVGGIEGMIDLSISFGGKWWIAGMALALLMIVHIARVLAKLIEPMLSANRRGKEQ